MTDPAAALDDFIDKYNGPVAAVGRAALAKLRARLPTATCMVYDNYNALAVGFGPDARTSGAILSLVFYPRWISLFLLRGVGLPDPEGLLRGSGTVVRHIVLKSADDLDQPAIAALVAAALAGAQCGLPAEGRGALIIKSVSAKQRSRR